MLFRSTSHPGPQDAVHASGKRSPGPVSLPPCQPGRNLRRTRPPSPTAGVKRLSGIRLRAFCPVAAGVIAVVAKVGPAVGQGDLNRPRHHRAHRLGQRNRGCRQQGMLGRQPQPAVRAQQGFLRETDAKGRCRRGGNPLCDRQRRPGDGGGGGGGRRARHPHCRRQKVWEQAPSLALNPRLREQLCASAVALARAVGYSGAGTVEYLYDDAADQFCFIEMNTRIQAEHPVTDIDLVAEMLRIAGGKPLRLRQADIGTRGHAIERHLNAEHPARDLTTIRYQVSGGEHWRMTIPPPGSTPNPR